MSVSPTHLIYIIVGDSDDMTLKFDLHCHVRGDPHDNIPYTAEQLIDRAAELKYEVLAITCHDKVICTDELKKYAESKNILLIPGAEKTLDGKHILLINIDQADIERIHSFDDIRELKKTKNIFVIAPHPYFIIGTCLGHRLEENIDVFDAIEYAHFHTYGINLNKKAVAVAKKYSKPLVGLSDCHNLFQFGTAYSMVNSRKNIPDILAAIKAGNVQHVSPPLSPILFLRISAWIIAAFTAYKLRALVKPNSHSTGKHNGNHAQ